MKAQMVMGKNVARAAMGIVCVAALSALDIDRTQAWDMGPPALGRVEVVLAPEHRQHVGAIKQDFFLADLTNVHFQFMRLGQPPRNLGVGPKVSADRARAAIRLAKKYNGGVVILLPDHLFPDHFVTIASSNYDDTVEYPVDADALRQLEDPSLTSEQWHELYRRLTPADRPPVRKGRIS